MTSSRVGKRDSPASQVKLPSDAEMRFHQEASPSLIQERVLVKLVAPRVRVDVGSNAHIDSVGSYQYKVRSVSDRLYGLHVSV